MNGMAPYLQPIYTDVVIFLKAHNCMKATKNIIMITFLHLRSSMQVYTFKAHTKNTFLL